MRILQVIPRFNPSLGGGVDVVFNLSKFLSRIGHEVTIITTDYQLDNNFVKEIESEGVTVIAFKHIFNLYLFIPAFKMKKWVSQNINNFDIVHLNGMRSYQNNIIHKYTTKHQIPYIIQAHGSVMRIIERKNLKKIYDIIWGYRLMKDAKRVIALNLSEAESYRVMNIDISKIDILPNGIDLEKFKVLPKKGEFRKKFLSNKNDKIILYLGRLHKSKGIDFLIKSFYEVKKSIDDVKLVFVGPDSGMKLKLIKMADNLGIGKDIIFTGLIKERDKIAAFIDSDVFVTPRFYGFPITFLEAMACGTPIVTTKAGEYIEGIDKNIGFVVDFDIFQFSSSIQKILRNDDIGNIFRKNTKNKSRDFNWPIIILKLEKIYEKSV